MPRFVVLRHEPSPGSDRPLHWDLLLELEDGLQSWALADEPRPGQTIEAEPLPAHRKLYLDYEGPVSGDRGVVKRWDGGEFTWVQQSPEQVVVRLAGQRLRGTMQLAPSATSAQRWTACFSSDEDAAEAC